MITFFFYKPNYPSKTDKMQTNKILLVIPLLFILLGMGGCEKDTWLHFEYREMTEKDGKSGLFAV